MEPSDFAVFRLSGRVEQYENNEGPVYLDTQSTNSFCAPQQSQSSYCEYSEEYERMHSSVVKEESGDPSDIIGNGKQSSELTDPPAGRSVKRKRNAKELGPTSAPANAESSQSEISCASFKWLSHVVEKITSLFSSTAMLTFGAMWETLKNTPINPLAFLCVTDTTVCSATFLKSNFMILFQKNNDVDALMAALQDRVEKLEAQLVVSSRSPISKNKPESICSPCEIRIFYPEVPVIEVRDQWITCTETDDFRQVHLCMVYVAFLARQKPSSLDSSRSLGKTFQLKRLTDSFVQLLVKPTGNQHWTMTDRADPQSNKTSTDTSDSGRPLPKRAAVFPDEICLKFCSLTVMMISRVHLENNGTGPTPKGSFFSELKYYLRHSLDDLHRQNRKHVSPYSDVDYRSTYLGMETHLGKRATEF